MGGSVLVVAKPPACGPKCQRELSACRLIFPHLPGCHFDALTGRGNLFTKLEDGGKFESRFER